MTAILDSMAGPIHISDLERRQALMWNHRLRTDRRTDDVTTLVEDCLLYTSDAADDASSV